MDGSALKTIAFLGIGLMGAPMARNLLKAGFKIPAWNRTRARAEALVAAGATLPEDAGAAVAASDMVITMLENGPAVEQVLFGPHGAAAAARPGTLFVDMSSIPPETARDHAARLAALNCAYLDAPVSGGTAGAEAASLAIMAGGDARDIESARPVFEALGRVTHVGPHGAGQLAKLANQTIVAVTIGAVSEALLLAAAGGADPRAVREAIRGGFAESRILELHGERMLARDFEPGGRAAVQLKDIDTIIETARQLNLELPAVTAVGDVFRSLVENGGGEFDHSAYLLELEAQNKPHKL